MPHICRSFQSYEREGAPRVNVRVRRGFRWPPSGPGRPSRWPYNSCCASRTGSS